MNKYLVGISYHDPETYQLWEDGVVEDYESSTGVFIYSNSKNKALEWAQQIAEDLFRKVNPQESKSWKSFGHSCWIEEDLDESGWKHCLDFFQSVDVGENPNYEKMGSKAYEEWHQKNK